jgi:AcrR family transcriptional regulator
MPRTLDPVAHALRRDAFLDSAQRLIEDKGYEQMSIQDVLDDLDASKGAFYHYFDSKADLLEAVVERLADVAIAALLPIVTDAGAPADEKFRRLFFAGGQWKAERHDLVLGLLEVWLSDANAVVREKLRRMGVTRLAPLLADIVRQGRAEGIFTVTSEQHAARVLTSLLDAYGETARELAIRRRADTVSLDEVGRTFAAYDEAVERVLGLPAGSFTSVDVPSLHLWFD